MEMHLKAIYWLIVLNDWVEPFFFKFLPISAQKVLVIRIEEQKEVLDTRDGFFQLEVSIALIEVVCNFL
jgi:hypothetical protein